MKHMKKGDLVAVTWEDSCFIGGGGWTQQKDAVEARREVLCYSAGFVLRDDKKGMILVGSHNNPQVGGVIIIPTSQIIRKRALH